MSEDKTKKVAKSSNTFYFLKGLKAGILFNPEKNEVLIRAKNGVFTTKNKKTYRLLLGKGYEQISSDQVTKQKKKLRKKG